MPIGRKLLNLRNLTMKKSISTLILLSVTAAASAAQLTAIVANQFKAGSPAKAETVNANFNQLAGNIQALVGQNAYVASSTSALIQTINTINTSKSSQIATIYLTPGVTYQLSKPLDLSTGHEIALTSMATDPATYPKLTAYQNAVMTVNGITPVHVSHIALDQLNPRLSVIEINGGHVSASFNNVNLLSAKKSQVASLSGNGQGHVVLNNSLIQNTAPTTVSLAKGVLAKSQNLTIK